MPPSPARRLGDQNAGAGQTGRVVLDELHVLERYAGPVSDGESSPVLIAAFV